MLQFGKHVGIVVMIKQPERTIYIIYIYMS